MAGNSSGERELAARRQNGCFVCGPENPHGLRIGFHASGGGRAEASWTPAASVEGYAGIVHGGVVAAVLDEAMSKAAASAGGPCFTAHLEVRYRHPVPSGGTYRIEGEITRHGKRRLLARARLTGADGLMHAEAAACFVRPAGTV